MELPERDKGEVFMKQCLYGTKSANCAAYCTLHKCNMTVRQIKQKECLRKQCRHLIKNEEHDYWRLRNAAKAKKKASREKFKMEMSVYDD